MNGYRKGTCPKNALDMSLWTWCVEGRRCRLKFRWMNSARKVKNSAPGSGLDGVAVKGRIATRGDSLAPPDRYTTCLHDDMSTLIFIKSS
jgi:hypothetical protein